MKALGGIARGLLGLIVDDWRLALAILVWLAIVWLAAMQIHGAEIAKCVGLFAGLALILVQSAWREARRPSEAGTTRKPAG